MEDERSKTKKRICQAVKDLREMAFELENLYYDMDDLTDGEYEDRVCEIEDKYSAKHITLW